MRRYISVQAKILPAMAAIFLLAMVLVTGYSANQQRERTRNWSESSANDVINSYMDSLNAMMFSGGMANRELLREKIIGRAEVLELRLLRGEAVNKTFGPGFDTEKPVDDLDRRGLQGERIVQLEERDGGRALTVVQPFFAVKNHNGTNCLTCHAVPENSVLGAVRLTYSLAKVDSAIEKELWTAAGINVAIFAAGILLIGLLLKRVVVVPLRRVRDTLAKIATDADLSVSVALSSNDEFKDVGEAVNEMLRKFRDSIGELVATTLRLSRSSEQLAGVASQTRSDISNQQTQTQQLTTAIDEMSAAAREVAVNSENAKVAAQEAQDEATSGKLVVEGVSTAIEALAGRVNNASQVVQNLAEGTENIRKVLEAITGIAEQTNLLALNAAIEAARAGDKGRGFAVVADEVRTLAQRTQQETRQIHDTIEQFQKASDEAVAVMSNGMQQANDSVAESRKASAALETITAAVNSITDMNSRIATAAEEQSAVAQEFTRSIHSICEITDSTAEGASKTADSSQEVYEAVENMEEIVKRFRT